MWFSVICHNRAAKGKQQGGLLSRVWRYDTCHDTQDDVLSFFLFVFRGGGEGEGETASHRHPTCHALTLSAAGVHLHFLPAPD